VTCVTGDGGLYYSIGELETAVRLDLALTLVVLNNASLGFQRHSDRLHQGEDYGDLRFHPGVDYVQIAKGFGWDAVQVASLPSFRDAYAAALAASVPTLIEVATDADAHPPITKFDDLHT
jgi:acetolactate synthase-1/2/3 large subunit